jgi:hypothetical protein
VQQVSSTGLATAFGNATNTVIYPVFMFTL